MEIGISAVAWKPCYRIIPSRFPPVSVFEAVADPADLEAVFAIEAMTNDRLREEAGDLSLVPPENRVSGPGSTPIMAAFTHLNPLGSRFSDGSYGTFYAGLTLETAIKETRHHRSIFLAATDEPPLELDMRVYAVDLGASLHDVRGMRETHPLLYHSTSYSTSQAVARDLRDAGSHGIVYESVRHEGGECASIFRPKLLSNLRQERHLCYVWDGSTISDIYEKKKLE